jgi:hypothetical protein
MDKGTEEGLQRETAVQMRVVSVNTFRIVIICYSEIWAVMDKLQQ